MMIKRLLLCLGICFTVSPLFAQLSVKVSIDGQDSVDIQGAGALAESGNSIKIKAPVGGNYRVVFRQSAANNNAFSISFNQSVDFQTGDMVRKFRDGELFGNGQHFSLPCEVIILKGRTKIKGGLIIGADTARVPVPMPPLAGIAAISNVRIPYYDALDLSSAGISEQQACNMLSYYCNSNTVLTREALKDRYAGNKFITQYLDTRRFTRASIMSGGAPTEGGFLSSIGSLNVTSLADGLVRFLVQRSKEELSVAFFRKFQVFLVDYPEAKTLFPATYSFIGRIHNYQYNAMLPAMRTGFVKDLDMLIHNLPKLRDIPLTDCKGNQSCEERLTWIATTANTTAGRAVIAALIIADNMRNGDDAAAVIHNIAQDPIVAEVDDNVSAVAKFTDLMSMSIRARDSTQGIWISTAEAKILLKNDTAAGIFLGLLVALDKREQMNITFKGSAGNMTFAEIVNDKIFPANEQLKMLMASFKTLSADAAAVSAVAQKIRDNKDASTEDKLMVYAEYTGAMSALLRQSITSQKTCQDLAPP